MIPDIATMSLAEFTVVALGIIAGMTQWSKTFLPESYRPMVCPAIAIVLGLVLGTLRDPSITGALGGLILGMTTSGLYDAGKDVVSTPTAH